jgi:hypothetical protein
LEARQSTRSLPFVELCLDAASLSIETGRRFADDSLARRRMTDSTDVWLMYPDDACAMSIQDAWHQRKSDNVTVVFLDATWQVRRWLKPVLGFWSDTFCLLSIFLIMDPPVRQGNAPT